MASDDDLEVIRLAAAFHALTGSREATARERWGLSGPRFWQRVARLIDEPAVEVALPVEVHRLRRQREAGRRLA